MIACFIQLVVSLERKFLHKKVQRRHDIVSIELGGSVIDKT